METTVVERLKTVMSAYNLKESTFAKAIGVAQTTMNEYFKDGSKREPSLSVMRKVVNAFADISPIWLYEGKGNMYVSDTLPPMTGNEGEEMLDLHAQIAKLTAERDVALENLRKAEESIKDLRYTVELQKTLLHGSHEDYIEEKQKKEVV